MEQFLLKDTWYACVWNNNLCAKPESSDTKSDLIYKCVFADFLYLAPRYYGAIHFKFFFPHSTCAKKKRD